MSGREQGERRAHALVIVGGDAHVGVQEGVGLLQPGQPHPRRVVGRDLRPALARPAPSPVLLDVVDVQHRPLQPHEDGRPPSGLGPLERLLDLHLAVEDALEAEVARVPGQRLLPVILAHRRRVPHRARLLLRPALPWPLVGRWLGRGSKGSGHQLLVEVVLLHRHPAAQRWWWRWWWWW
jgi:hypothetical protein